MQEASVSRHQEDNFWAMGEPREVFLLLQYSVIFHKIVTFFQRLQMDAGSWRHSSRIIRVIVVPVAVGIDIKEIVAVVVIRGTDEFRRNTPKD